MTNLQFAHISDIHICHTGNHDDVLGGEAASILEGIVQDLNQQPHLDGVFISGDLVDHALPQEFDQFEMLIKQLTVPVYIIPGNHDRRAPNTPIGLSRKEFARRFNPQYTERSHDDALQAGYWSQAITPQVQLIGLDSIRDEDWGGVIDESQLGWLTTELATHRDKCVIVMVHHPLHELSPIDKEWTNFVCDNGSAVLDILNDHPQVKLVLTGHHHLIKADIINQRLHLAAPAISIYPCGYRTISLTSPTEGEWRFRWQTHQAGAETLRQQAKEMMHSTWVEAGFEADFVETQIEAVQGDSFDQAGEFVAKG